ncbi:MAG: IS1595 family transposase [Gammaproteobacteria bacterium]|nr:IS1595 family transposase [Gammaproteobacteria bacterium]
MQAQDHALSVREKECSKKFSVKTGTVMQSSNLGYQTWAIAIYLVTTSLKGVSSMKLHKDLDITQKSAWHLAHRIRASFQSHQTEAEALLKGPIEQDETYFGVKRRNMSNSKRKELSELGRGAIGKTAVVGLKDRESNEVRAKVVQSTDAETLIGFAEDNVEHGATIYTDEATAYNSLPSCDWK